MNTFKIDVSQFDGILEPVIITFNRAQNLQATLEAFADSELREMTLHVLDNDSTDETPSVVRDMQTRLPNLLYHRNADNIGGNANILRSVELSNAYYHWVIGDDDEWSLDAEIIQELMSVLAQRKADVIRLGWLVSDKSRGLLLDARALIKEEKLFFASLSMISATIIKRSHVTKYLPQAYQNINDSYPQLVAPICAIEHEDLRVYTMQQDLMTHTPSQVPGYFAGDFEWYAGWYRTSRFFKDTHLKKTFVREISYYMCRQQPGVIHEQIWLIKVLLYYKSFGLNQWPYLLSMLAYGSGRRMSTLLLMLLNAITPVFMLSMFRKLVFKLKKLPPKSIQVDRSRL
jgi:glycosyltransferase involved in cell wall biosynthesis